MNELVYPVSGGMEDWVRNACGTEFFFHIFLFKTSSIPAFVRRGQPRQQGGNPTLTHKVFATSVLLYSTNRTATSSSA